MLSVLIPVYNYDIRALVTAIQEQLLTSQIPFEIICMDDGSKSNFRTINSEIEQLEHTGYRVSNSNLGRVATRKSLAENASYNWLLFLDADVIPRTNQFINNYIPYLHTDYEAVYGGFAYKEDQPEDDLMLRWTYGRSNEQVSAHIRNKTPYKIVISANFLIKKTRFLELSSYMTNTGYGYDNYFGALLKEKTVKVFHIDNEVFHLGLESSASYLKKIEESIDNLLQLDTEDKLKTTDNSLLKLFKLFKTYKLHKIWAWVYKTFGSSLKSNLLSKRPSVFMLQCYKLSYICYQDQNS
ncbi:glycosyltransferase family 2 protein [uncultured Psychroserpens sp.]|uniref:glycosyltransferase family 2 protein n=1 Tax=uncultured Psychroserpens sp. TaxID=255436 RepID=UPI00263A03B3|nr:glycosyltransferase family 2 protein [uncultured Psychroserpens sp.]